MRNFSAECGCAGLPFMLGSNQVLKPHGWVTEEGLWGSPAERNQPCRRLCLDHSFPDSIREGLGLCGTNPSSGVSDVVGTALGGTVQASL